MFWLIVNVFAVAWGIAREMHPAIVAGNAFVAGLWLATLVSNRVYSERR